MYHSNEFLTTGSTSKPTETDQNIDAANAAFEEAFSEAQGTSSAVDRSAILAEQYANRVITQTNAQETQEKHYQPAEYQIGSDRILDESRDKWEEHNEADEADELAKTAGNLLENVKGDQSKKFRDSNFLSLMRQLRDREVKVDGDKIVDNVSLDP